MSFLRGSTNYVWCTTSVLGKGATGAVYQGVNKHTGEAVAVKTFNQLSHMRPQEVQMREFEVLRKVKHENIVKLLAIEEELEGRGKVIVMELCTGGSLFNILDDPENTYGLEEKEFLLVLSHLSEGMKHLRDNNLVHRDLKPGNIMKFIAADGSTIYKLTDFGAARELDDDQQFMSLYGTEEYLHPDMYERAVLRKPVGKTFGATVDLWSIGVTLFHVATGQLPFRPFGGRRNKETMYYITTEKASGVISGVQMSENGPIEWSRNLPEGCPLSMGAQKYVTPLLAGLLEVDPKKMWNFDKFFVEVTNFLLRKKMDIFYLNRLQSLTVYLHPEDKLSELQFHILEQTDIPTNSQILLYESKPFEESVGVTTRSQCYPSTSLDTPIILFNEENNNVSLHLNSSIPKFPSFPSVLSMENDAVLAKLSCSIGHMIKRSVECLTRCQHLMQEAVNMLLSVITEQLSLAKGKSDEAQKLSHSQTQRLELLVSFHSSLFLALDALASKNSSLDVSDARRRLADLISNKQHSAAAVKEQLEAVVPHASHLYSRVVGEGTLKKEWLDATRGMKDITKCANKAHTYITKLRESWQHLLRDKAAKNLTYNDEQFHMLEKIKMQETSKSLQALLNSECSPTIHVMAECLADWYKMAQATFVQTELVRKDLQSVEEMSGALSQSLDEAQTQYLSQVEHILTHAKSLKAQRKGERDGDAARKKELKRNVSHGLHQLCAGQAELWQILQENNELLTEFCSVLTQLPPAGTEGRPTPENP